MFGNINKVQTLLQTASGLRDIFAGESLSRGAMQSRADGFLNSKATVNATTNYNIALERINFERQTSALSNELRNLRSSQIAATAASGFDTGSQSFLDVANDTLSAFESSLVDLTSRQERQEEIMRYNGEVAKSALQGQADAASYQGEVAKYNASIQKSRVYNSLLNQVISLS